MLTALLAPHPASADASPAAAGEKDGNEQTFLDDDGTLRSFDHEYERWFLHRKPHYFRAAVESVIAVGLGTAYYWADPLANEVDWDDPSVGSKVTGEAVRFDTNLRSTNFILHPLAGAVVYDVARANGLDVYASFVYGVASAAAWEFALEWREQVSVNDMVFTPIGGMALGEFFFRLGDYTTTVGPRSGWANQTARYTLGLLQTAHDAADGLPLRDTRTPEDGLGFSSAYWHRFALRYGAGFLENDVRDRGFVQSFEASADLVALPGFLRTGVYHLSFDEGNFTEARLRMLFGGGELRDVDAWVSAVHFGRYSQSFGTTGGGASLFGLGTALRYFDSWRLDRRDSFSFAHLPGPVFGLWQRTGKLQGEVRVEAHVDFAAIRPLAYPAWSARFGTDGVKTVLLKQSYTFAGCGSTQARVRFAYDAVLLGAFANVARCHSIQGLDRFQADVTRDVPTTDDVVELRAYAAVKADPMELRAQFEKLRRRGEMGAIERRTWDDYLGVTVGYLF